MYTHRLRSYDYYLVHRSIALSQQNLRVLDEFRAAAQAKYHGARWIGTFSPDLFCVIAWTAYRHFAIIPVRPKNANCQSATMPEPREWSPQLGYFAHSLPDSDISNWEPLESHLAAVAARAADFAGSFGAADWGRLAGLWHDPRISDCLLTWRQTWFTCSLDHPLQHF